MSKFRIDIQQSVTFRHKVEVEAGMDEVKMTKFLHEFDIQASINMMCMNDMVEFLQEKGLKVIDVCEDGSGSIDDIETWYDKLN